MKLIVHLHLMLRLRVPGSLLPLPDRMSSWHAQGQLYLTLLVVVLYKEEHAKEVTWKFSGWGREHPTECGPKEVLLKGCAISDIFSAYFYPASCLCKFKCICNKMYSLVGYTFFSPPLSWIFATWKYVV